MKRKTETEQRRQQCNGQILFKSCLQLFFALTVILSREHCLALTPSLSTKTKTRQSQILSNARRGGTSVASSSPLFASAGRRQQLQRSQRINRGARSSSTALHMVVTTPEAIIEQASTVNLLDDLIDESVRTSARRPVMRQFDPSSGWVSFF